MLGYSKIQIMGNLGSTPEMKYLPSGDPVVNFNVAVNRRYKDREGNQKEATTGIASARSTALALPAPLTSAGATQFSAKEDFRCGPTNRRMVRRFSVEIIPSVVRFLGSGRGARATAGKGGGTPAEADGLDGVDPDSVPF